MTDQEVKAFNERYSVYATLTLARDKAYAARRRIMERDEAGPCGQGPFTGNTRESRQVEDLRIRFTCTRGGAPAVDEFLVEDLYIEAWEFGNYIVSKLDEKIKRLDEEIEKL